MRGYDESKLTDTDTIRDKSSFYNAKRLFLDTKKKSKERNKKFFSHPN